MTKETTNATQYAEPEQARLHLSELTHLLDTTQFEKNEDGDFTNRPNLNVYATLSHETEDYARIIKTLWDMLPVYSAALDGTYYGAEISRERYKTVLALFTQLRNEIAHDMGVCIADRLSEWKEDYM